MGRRTFTLGALVAGSVALLGAPMLLMTAGGGTSCTAAGGAGTLAPAGGQLVGASVFGGPADAATPGSVGAGGDLRGHVAFAELSSNWSAPSGWDFSALGGLAMGSRLRITANGRSVIAVKRDVGRGGPPVGAPPAPRRIDLWWETARALGLPGSWSGLVHIERTGGEEKALGEPSPPTCGTPGSGRGGAIVSIAREELGTREPEAWDRYGPDPWCARFVSWVWQRAGIDVPRIAFTGALYMWAQDGGGEALPATATPHPGDAILYGTGPSSPQTSEHVGLVEQVFPNGEITTIEGNTAGGVSVARIGPFLPQHATATPAFRPAPVYGYARPRRTR